mgnify:CR=1 FL=1
MEMFYVARDFVIEKPMYADELRDFTQTHPGVLDERNNIYSYDNKMNLETYYNYIESIKTLSQKFNFGKYKYMLKLGYIPLLMVPSPYKSVLHETIMPRLEASGIPYVKLQPMSFIKLSYTFIEPDIWISKMDAAEFLGCKPTDVRVKGVINNL